MAVVSDELRDSDDQPPHQAGVQSDPGGVWTHQGAGNRAEPLSVSHLCHRSQRQGFGLESLVITAMVIPASLLTLLQAVDPLYLDSLGASQAERQGTSWGAPAPDSPQTTPTLK